MIELEFAPKFLNQLKKLEPVLQRGVVRKVELFRNPKNHKLIKVHKLHGPLKDRYSFSINSRIRVVFQYQSQKFVSMLAIGDHDLYR